MLIRPLHTPGRHCASTGLSNLAAFHGLGWSEAMCFGLGSGLGILYIESTSPSRILHVRSADLEEQFFARIGMPLPWEKFATPELSLDALIKTLDVGIPAIIQTDIFYLPYYRSSTHFPGHVITVWGHDPEKKVFLVTDTDRAELIEVGFADMAKARFWTDSYFDIRGNCMAPASLAPPSDMAETIRAAIVHNSHAIMHPDEAFRGMPALRRIYKELPQWADLQDRQWTFRFAYQVIEKRGTGGGGFRLMYRDFLEEARLYLPEVETMGLPRLMGEAAAAWSALAMAFKAASEREVLDTAVLMACLENLIRVESAYHQEAMRLG